MTKAGERLIAAAREAVDIVKGTAPIPAITIDGKRFAIGQKVVDSDPVQQDRGTICELDLPDLAEDGPIHVKWEAHEAPEPFFADEMIWSGDGWVVE